MSEQVAQASVRVQQEKDRLAALMAELNQSVVVCNRDGRILLYNQRAASSSAPLARAWTGRWRRIGRYWPLHLCRV